MLFKNYVLQIQIVQSTYEEANGLLFILRTTIREQNPRVPVICEQSSPNSNK